MRVNDKVKNILDGRGLFYIILGNIYHFCKYVRIYFFQILFRVIKINKRKIVFNSYYGKGYGDNAKAIAEKLIEKGDKCQIIWLVNDKKAQLPSGIKKVKYGSIACLYELTTARIVVDNCRTEYFLLKRKGQYYIQVWHASIGLKKVEKDAEDSLTKDYVKRAKIDAKNTDLMVSGNNFSSVLYRRAFWYNGKILEKGTPKCDILIDEGSNGSLRKSIKKRLGLDGKKVLLYAPTFRNSKNLSCYNINYQKLTEALREKWGEEWVILVRLHPNMSAVELKKVLREKNVLDMTSYADIQDLMVAADVCITDYSSVMFEFSYMKKPVFLFASDVNDYNGERGCYFDFNDLPFPLAENNEELVENIATFSVRKYHKDLFDFFDKIGLCESGNAADAVVKIIEGKMEGI